MARTTDRERNHRGLAPLERRLVLDQIARQHSVAMAHRERAMGHDGFADRFAQARDELQIVAFAENVGWISQHPRPVEEIVAQWLESPDHRDNLLGDWTATGIGAARTEGGGVSFTQVFAK